MVLEEEIWRLQEENDRKEETIHQLRDRELRRAVLEEELKKREEEVQHMKTEQVLLEQQVKKLTGTGFDSSEKFNFQSDLQFTSLFRGAGQGRVRQTCSSSLFQ